MAVWTSPVSSDGSVAIRLKSATSGTQSQIKTPIACSRTHFRNPFETDRWDGM